MLSQGVKSVHEILRVILFLWYGWFGFLNDCVKNLNCHIKFIIQYAKGIIHSYWVSHQIAVVIVTSLRAKEISVPLDPSQAREQYFHYSYQKELQYHRSLQISSDILGGDAHADQESLAQLHEFLVSICPHAMSNLSQLSTSKNFAPLCAFLSMCGLIVHQ